MAADQIPYENAAVLVTGNNDTGERGDGDGGGAVVGPPLLEQVAALEVVDHQKVWVRLIEFLQNVNITVTDFQYQYTKIIFIQLSIA